MKEASRIALASLILGIVHLAAVPAAFQHPGVLHTQADLDRMKQMVQQGVEPFKSGFENLRTHPQSQADWRIRGPFEVVSRGAGQELHRAELVQDGNAAYQNALMWAITGDKAHAQKAVEILNAWSGTLKQIVGRDNELAASLCGFKYANAAEIMRYAYDGWAPADIARCAAMLKNVFYPVIEDFATFANGNWDTGCIKTMMAIGVFCNDRAIFDRAVEYYRNGSGNGRLTHYIINEDGQCQESGRDQSHTQLGLAHLAEACEIGWSQGLDLYEAADNRLLKGFEYTARYNLGQEVPFTPYRDKTGKYYAEAISTQRRDRLRPIFEMAWNHYEKRKGIPAPYTRQAAEKIRPEGAAFDADHPGFGTLLFTLPAAHAAEVKSPDGRVKLSFDIKDFEGAVSCPVYSVTYRDRAVIAPSRMGLELAGSLFREGLQIVRQTESHEDTQWKPVYGERSTIRDHYNQVVVELQEPDPPRRLLHLTLRAYDEGVAFCYTLPVQPDLANVTISREATEFRFPADYSGWATYTAQGVYSNVPVSQIKSGCERPLVIRVADDLYMALAEARLVNYARTKFGPCSPAALGWETKEPQPGAAVPHCLVTELGSEVSLPLPLRTPWRVVCLADSPGQLLERNDIILNLNDACAIADTSWIKPGKVIREVTLTTVGGKACVDFAVKHNLQYVEFDAGWYGPENDNASDARAVNLDPKRSKGPLDLQEVIRYAGERGLGIILYVNHKALERQLDELLPLYRQWGVKGIKFGFVNVGSQQWTSWMHEAIRKAAEHRLMVDVHDEYRPTGWSRTYPNFMTQEGIRGDEERQPNSMTLTTLFTRMIAGAGDNTICYYDERVDRQATHAYQLAKAVCFYSPWQFVFWYDRPFVSREVTGRAPDARNVIGDEPELEFFAHCPTVWDDTRVLHGSIGAYAVIARRSGDNWFMGGMNTDEPRSFDVPLEFLDADKKYVAHIYSDDPSVPTRTHVRIEQLAVNRETVLKMAMPARGGQAIRLVACSPAAPGWGIEEPQPGAAVPHNSVVTLEPKPLSGVLLNPGKGWSAGGLPERHPKEVLDLLGMGVMRLDWATVEPQEGQFNWSALDRFLDSWGRLGRVCNVGIMCANTHSRAPEGYVTPKWVFDAGAKKIEIVLNPTQSTTGTPGKKVAPVFDDPVFLAKFADFLRAFAARYDGDPRIAVLDIRSYGNWGEAHMHPFGGPDIAPEDFRRHVQMHLDAFDKTQLCLSCNAHLGKFGPLKPIFDWAVLEKRIAPRRDGICGNSDGRETAIGLGIAPGVFELFDNYDGVKRRGWWDGQKDKSGCGFRLEECVENGKPTWVDLGRGGQSGLRMLQENRALIERLTNHIGYHFHLQRAVYPRRAARDGFELELTWINQGVAPIYIPCAVAVALLDGSGKRIGTVWPGECDPHKWMPGRPAIERARVSCPEIPVGEYRLALALVRTSGDAVPHIRLGTDLPTADGWYVLGPQRVE